jgi:hypothetical protein
MSATANGSYELIYMSFQSAPLRQFLRAVEFRRSKARSGEQRSGFRFFQLTWTMFKHRDKAARLKQWWEFSKG